MVVVDDDEIMPTVAAFSSPVTLSLSSLLSLLSCALPLLLALFTPTATVSDVSV